MQKKGSWMHVLLLSWAVQACEAETSEPAQTPPAQTPPAAADGDPRQFVGKWFYDQGTIQDFCRGGAAEATEDDAPGVAVSLEFRGPGIIVQQDTFGNPEQILHIKDAEKQGENWILTVEGEADATGWKYQGQRLLRWIKPGEEMQYGMLEDGGGVHTRLDRDAQTVEQGDCGLPTP